MGQDKVFGEDTNAVVILSRSGSEPQEASGSKKEVAAAVVDLIPAELSRVVPRPDRECGTSPQPREQDAGRRSISKVDK